jgi:hypothetical protein
LNAAARITISTTVAICRLLRNPSFLPKRN